AHAGPRAARHVTARGRDRFTARAPDRSARERRLDRAAATARSRGRDSAGALRSAHVRGQEDRRATAFARRAFSGAPGGARVARCSGKAGPARHRFDPALFGRAGRGRFAGAFWPGPFFWPYAYYDDTFWLWPSAYDEAFWAYGYDDVLRGVYRPYAFADYDEFLEGVGRPVRRARGAAPPSSFGEFCGEAAPGLTDWPVDRIVNAA